MRDRIRKQREKEAEKAKSNAKKAKGAKGKSKNAKSKGKSAKGKSKGSKAPSGGAPFGLDLSNMEMPDKKKLIGGAAALVALLYFGLSGGGGGGGPSVALQNLSADICSMTEGTKYVRACQFAERTVTSLGQGNCGAAKPMYENTRIILEKDMATPESIGASEALKAEGRKLCSKF